MTRAQERPLIDLPGAIGLVAFAPEARRVLQQEPGA